MPASVSRKSNKVKRIMTKNSSNTSPSVLGHPRHSTTPHAHLCSKPKTTSWRRVLGLLISQSGVP